MRGFDEGFDSFPKRLPEDCVEYAIYVISTELVTEAEQRARLREIQKASKDLVKTLLKEYVWQQDEFCLELERDSACAKPVLHGRTQFGDSIADEWLVVYLLRELSRHFEDAWVRVSDTDGEFLLIEAAAQLPKWLNPEVAANRVWINKGQLKIIPLDKTVSSNRDLSLASALRTLRAQFPSLLHDASIEAAALSRSPTDSSSIYASQHTSIIPLPRKLAYILHHLPFITSLACTAFYLRDPISMHHLNASSPSVLRFAPDDLVHVSVRFTKVSFAQLKAQVFEPHRLNPWSELHEEYRPSVRNSKSQKDFERLDMAMKITYGFEILLSDKAHANDKVVREIEILLEDLESGGEILPSDTEIAQWLKYEDGEEWLNVEWEDFESTLNGKIGGKSGFGDKNAEAKLQKIVQSFQDFLREDEAADPGSADEMDEDDDHSYSEDDRVGEHSEDSDIELDQERFASMMRDMLGMSTSKEDEIPTPVNTRSDEGDKSIIEDLISSSRARRRGDEDGGSSDEEVQMFSKTRRSAYQAQQRNSGARKRPDLVASNPLPRAQPGRSSGPRIEELPNSSDEEEGKKEWVDEDEEDMAAVIAAMEQELRSSGALSLDDNLGPSGKRAVKAHRSHNDKDDDRNHPDADDEQDSQEDGEEIDIDYNLAKNILESFKSQAGLAGPAGNILGLMGMGSLPRDEGGEDDEVG